jgi:tetratricopeptide (TPR) repeat protein
LSEVGRYEDAERAGARFATTPANALQISNALGEVHLARGKVAEAEAAFARAVTQQATDSIRALVNLAIVTFERGNRDSAMKVFDHFIDVYNRGAGSLSSEDLTAVGIACRFLGLDSHALFGDALKAFDRAIAADSLNMEPRVRVAELFLEKFNNLDAQPAFDEVLALNPRHPRALLGVAKRRLSDGHPGSDSLLSLALEVNPALLEAHVLRARMRAGAEAYDSALVQTNRALQIDPTSPAALAVVAAIHYLRGDSAGYRGAVSKALQRSPRGAEFYITVAELTARNRLYRAAAAFASQAIELDARSWPAHAELGLNQLRVGLIDEGRKSLETSFAGDPYNVLVKNTLDLLDTFKEYDIVEGGRFRLMIAKQESALLGLYALDLLERAYDSLSTRYGYSPEPPIRIEFYRRHADFSVRTVGLTGIGALGVSFGNVLAMDSPTGRETGPFNWGSVLWHELGHTFTLGLTNHKVPRWFSEGLSVHEERKSGMPGWGADVTGEFLRALKAGLLVKVSSFNDGFMRPRYPEQLLHSYYQASLLCEMIEARWGARALVAMLAGYKEGRSTDEVFRSVLSLTPEQMDERFDEYLRTRFREPLNVVGVAGVVTRGSDGETRVTQEPDSGEYAKTLMAGITAREGGNNDEALRQFRRAIELFPQYADAGSPYVQIAGILAERNDHKGAAEQLARHNAIDENSYATLVAEAGHREAAGDFTGAARALDRSMYIYPYDIKSHEKLAELAGKAADKKMVVRERRAIVALRPVDMAEAQYQLALALFENGETAAARREVLRSLEEAPNFGKAQELLLRIRGGDSASMREPR